VKKLLRLFALVIVGLGALLLSYSMYEGLSRGFGIDIDGNWDPAIVGLSGLVLLVVGTLAYYVLAHTAPGIRARTAILKGVRATFVATLVLGEVVGVVMGISGFMLFLAHERMERYGGLWALAMCGCGIVSYCAATYLLPWARGDAAKKPETFVSHDDTLND
jgi:hypothetical protein